jgi:class 3 adenylate cyclase
MKNDNNISKLDLAGEGTSHRMDFIMKVTEYDPHTGRCLVRLTPDPERYKWIEKNGVKYLYDKFDHMQFGPEVMRQMAASLNGLPIYCQPPFVESIAGYLEGRIPAIEAGLHGEPAEEALSDPSAEFLAHLTKSKQGFAIMCIDIAGSTKLTHAVAPDDYARLISTMLGEMSQIVYLFRGHVLKYTGDGLIAYFPEPSLITMNDLAFDCACSLRVLVEKIFNPISAKRGLPSINIRIGIDSGQANVITLGSPQTKRQKDIIGKAINIAAKIQALGAPGDILIGETASRLVHVKWREGLDELTLPETWQYENKNGVHYRVFKLRGGFYPKPSVSITN